jgi:hypothetical protein
MTPKPILLIAGCRKYEPYLVAAIRRFADSTWEVLGVLGDPTVPEPVYTPDTRILTLPCSDTYECLPAKLHAAYSWIAENRPGIPGIFKTDEDMLFNLKDLADAVTRHQSVPYWGVTASICQAAPVNPQRIQARFTDPALTPSHQAAVYCFGAGYWISKAALPIVIAASRDYKGSALEDVCTGFVLNRAGIYPTKVRLPFAETPRNAALLTLEKMP